MPSSFPRRLRRFPSLVAGLCAGLFVAGPWQQDPPPPAPPPATQQPAPEPGAPPPVVPGRPVRHALQGVYELRRRVMDNKVDGLPSRGYLAITNRHLFLCLAAPGPDRDLPLVRAGVRTWKPLDDQVQTTIQLGWFTDKDGGVHVERPGTEERRRLQLVQGGIRVVQDERNWLEFERVE